MFRQTTRMLAAGLVYWAALACCLSVWAEKPPKLNAIQIEELTRDGDRLADQGDYLAALGKYTQAYLGVVSSIRGQDFSMPVTPSIFNREQLGLEMLEQMKKEYSAEDLLLMDASYKVLGLISPDLDSEKLITQLLTEEVAGFYDPDNKRMVLIVEDGPKKDPGWLGRLLGARPTFDKDEQKTTLAHELTHALQDQLYDLNAMQEGIEDDDDMLVAFSSLVEGDATLLMFAEAQGSGDIRDMDPEAMRITFNLMSWMLPLAGGEAYRKAPPIFRDSLVFPYFQGMIFTLSVAAQEGWPSVHQAYQDPPLSTEQIMHPDKYLDPNSRDVPRRVLIPDCSGSMGEAWKHLGGNCLGELQTTILFKKVVGGSRAAEGWDGDRYEVYQRDDGKLAMLWVSVWDSQEDAQEFEIAYRKMRESNPFGSQAVFAAEAVRSIVRQDDRVYIVEGFTDAEAQKLSAQIQESQFEEKRFPLP